ncbi:alkane 1-monooxygenase [Algiphilus sp.]|uniref:alkane 1-monooxygenase n=1 Tax=Algiphilus sp. TaxID=1872431 RepID=UPI003B527466
MLLTRAFKDPASSAEYIDRKRGLWILSTLYPIVPGLIILAGALGGHPWLFWATPVLFYIGIAAMDHLRGEDNNNPPEWAVSAMDADPFYRTMALLAVPGHFLTLIAGAWAFTSGAFPLWSLVGLVWTVGIISGLAINTGHELGHKKSALERWFAKIVLAMPAYGHFFIEHNKGHHRDVATPEDPASSMLGENFYRFAFTREIPQTARRAWRIERDRLQRTGSPVWSVHNEILQSALITVVLYGALVAAFGWMALPFLLLQAFLGYLLLSQANYIEHYGLCRQRNADGRYERPRPEHSWNTNHILSNLVLFHLQRHSDHHANPTRRFQALRHFDGLPRLPSGYPGMFMLALVPPLWRAVMDHRVAEHYGYDLSRANVDPRKRAALEARFAHRSATAEHSASMEG